jgi:hypothetical protein
VHEGGFAVERAGPKIRFRRPNGELIHDVGRMPCVGSPLVGRQPESGLSIDQRTCMPRSAGDPLDYGLAVEVILGRELAAR